MREISPRIGKALGRELRAICQRNLKPKRVREMRHRSVKPVDDSNYGDDVRSYYILLGPARASGPRRTFRYESSVNSGHTEPQWPHDTRMKDVLALMREDRRTNADSLSTSSELPSVYVLRSNTVTEVKALRPDPAGSSTCG